MIRRAQAADVPAIARLLIQVHDQHVREHPAIFRPISLEQASHQVAAVVDAGWYAVHEAERIDGMIKWSVQERGESFYTLPSRCVVVDEIAVDAAARRRGIGQRLLAWVEERAREAGVQRLQLDAWATNGIALGAFQKAGFTVYTRRLWRWLAP